MRSLVIAPQPFLTPRGTPFSVYYRTLVMSELGVQVDLLCYGEGEDIDVPKVRIVRIPRFRFLGPIRIGPSPQKAFLDIFMLLRHRYDYEHAHEESAFWCRFLKADLRSRMEDLLSSDSVRKGGLFNVISIPTPADAGTGVRRETVGGARPMIAAGCPFRK